VGEQVSRHAYLRFSLVFGEIERRDRDTEIQRDREERQRYREIEGH
jgi:hypothetical protein